MSHGRFMAASHFDAKMPGSFVFLKSMVLDINIYGNSKLGPIFRLTGAVNIP